MKQKTKDRGQISEFGFRNAEVGNKCRVSGVWDRGRRTEFGSWNVEVESTCYVSALTMAEEAASLIEKESSALPV